MIVRIDLLIGLEQQIGQHVPELVNRRAGKALLFARQRGLADDDGDDLRRHRHSRTALKQARDDASRCTHLADRRRHRRPQAVDDGATDPALIAAATGDDALPKAFALVTARPPAGEAPTDLDVALGHLTQMVRRWDMEHSRLQNQAQAAARNTRTMTPNQARHDPEAAAAVKRIHEIRHDGNLTPEQRDHAQHDAYRDFLRTDFERGVGRLKEAAVKNAASLGTDTTALRQHVAQAGAAYAKVGAERTEHANAMWRAFDGAADWNATGYAETRGRLSETLCDHVRPIAKTDLQTAVLPARAMIEASGDTKRLEAFDHHLAEFSRAPAHTVERSAQHGQQRQAQTSKEITDKATEKAAEMPAGKPVERSPEEKALRQQILDAGAKALKGGILTDEEKKQVSEVLKGGDMDALKGCADRLVEANRFQDAAQQHLRDWPQMRQDLAVARDRADRLGVGIVPSDRDKINRTLQGGDLLHKTFSSDCAVATEKRGTYTGYVKGIASTAHEQTGRYQGRVEQSLHKDPGLEKRAAFRAEMEANLDRAPREKDREHTIAKP